MIKRYITAIVTISSIENEYQKVLALLLASGYKLIVL